ncbi:hypothetical protein GCM10020219_081430 [Nonomuraea dietziae]
MRPSAQLCCDRTARAEKARARIASRPVVALGTGQLDRREHRVDHAVEDRVLVRYVVVERHRLHTQFLRHPSHRDRLHAAAIRDPDRGFQYEASAERLWGWRHDSSRVWTG